ncbi:MAG: phenylacetate-CoA oxygenase subunit PaaJ [Bacteroidia bacterium]|nr:phenylacetate-CoA oxygenase subunit PaaJ [Bacteroidia bacterium]
MVELCLSKQLKIIAELPTKESIIKLLSAIPDPEIPVINIFELGVLRNVELINGTCIVTITPTYSGCPAMKLIENQISAALKAEGINEVQIKMVYSPPWTTDWISDEAKEKLRQYGIAPPEKSTMDKGILLGKNKQPACPQCSSINTSMISQFGSTACKALYRCNNCKEPFDYFKCI